jgi:hypothetical protein
MEKARGTEESEKSLRSKSESVTETEKKMVSVERHRQGEEQT